MADFPPEAESKPAIVPGMPGAPGGAWQRIRQVRASDEIVHQFRRALFEGRLKAGDPIGSEKQLTEQFGVSRTTVRDALRTLETNGIVEIRTGMRGGARIAHGDPLRFADVLAIQLQLVGVQRSDVLSAQLGLESVAAELAAANATDEDFANIEALLDRGPAEDLLSYRESNYAFHEAIAYASHNWPIVTTLRAVHDILKEPPPEGAPFRPPRAESILAQHQAIYEAIKLRDGAQAFNLMREHIGRTRDAKANEGYGETNAFTTTPEQ